jgi:serine/threonine-protein kinase PpkA
MKSSPSPFRCPVSLSALFGTLALASFLAPSPVLGQQARSPIILEGKSILPLRVLARPFSHIYNEPDPAKGIARENVPPFSSYYVYTRPIEKDGKDQKMVGGEGWYEVGSDNRATILGWMRNEDVMEWKQTLCLEFEHPQGRNPVLLFKERDTLLSDLIEAPTDRRAKEARKLYSAIEDGKIDDAFPVLSVEPKRAVDISTSFYLMPILDHEEIKLDAREGRLLRIAAATGAADGRGATLVADEKFRETANVGSELDNAKLDKLTIDLVYVMDLTLSMEPFVDATRDLIQKISGALDRSGDLQGRIRFGFWGYRDSGEIANIEFNTKNYTPTLQSAAEFANTMTGVAVTRTDSVDFEEDVFAGVADAITRTPWSPNALRFIILIGDAPSHELGHKWNSSGMDAVSLRELADVGRVSIFAMHLKDSKFPQFHDAAREQFQTLAANRGMGTQTQSVSYHALNAREVGSFTEGSIGFFEPLQDTLETAVRQSGGTVRDRTPIDPPPATPTTPTTPDPARQQVRELSREMVRAALVDWIGRQNNVQAPRDVVAWVTDKDLVDPSVQSLKVNVLLTKNQLDALNSTLKATLQAGLRGQLSGRGFFAELQSVSATATVKPDAIKNAKRFADTGIAPEFLIGLPYKSEVMNLTPELWSSWSEDRQQRFLLKVESKIEYYATIHDKPERWVALSEGADEDEKVAPIPLSMLP